MNGKKQMSDDNFWSVAFWNTVFVYGVLLGAYWIFIG
jgi:hypothetical protein